MTAAATSFYGYTSYLKELYDKDPSSLLGTLAWYTVPGELYVDYHEYLRRVMETGAPVGTLHPPKPVDVFLRACTNAEKGFTKLITDRPEVFADIRVRKVGSDGDWVVRKVVVEYVDLAGHRIDFREIADLRFHKREHLIVAQQSMTVDAFELVQFEQLVAAVRSYFADKKMKLNDYGVRESIRRGITGQLSATMVKDGLYFIGAAHFEKLEALEELIGDLPGVTFNQMPVPDHDKQREMVKQAFEDESVGEMQRLIADIADAPHPITEKQLAKFQERYAAASTKIAEYKNVLDDSLETAQASLALCLDALTQAFKGS